MNLDEIIAHRIQNRIPWKELQNVLSVDEVYVAGNCLNRSNPNDIDLFPVGKDDFNHHSSNHILSSTPNAVTIKEDGVIIQLCSYYWPSLIELVDSFDFAHIQIGANINIRNLSITDIYYSDNWVEAHQMQSTWFTHSAYPLSSLIRINKYIQRGEFAGKSYIPSILNILTSIVSRGFEDYTDFKNQLDAVDLGLLPEDFDSIDKASLLTLFDLLKK